MAEQEMFNEAMEAIHQGDRKRARDLLSRLLKVNPSNVDYWTWMSSVVDSSQERIYCLQEVLKHDPQNPTARRGLVILGVLAPEPDQLPPPGILQRKWQVAMPASDGNQPKPGDVISKPTIVAGLLLIVAAVLVCVFVVRPLFSGVLNRPTAVSYHPTFPTAGPSPTMQITFTPVVRSPTPTFIGPTPLWMQLPATYTPTLLYVNTPHPLIEAYRAAMTAYERGELSKAIPFFEQVIVSQADAVDALYYLGECYRQQGDYAKALSYYNQAIKLQPAFAPPYLGRAEATYVLTPGADIMPDLKNALAIDSNLGEAYVEEAVVAIDNGDYPSALDYLVTAEEKLPGSPLVPLYRAKVYLAEGMPEEGLTAALEANQLDLTLLPTYLVLGEALQANARFADSKQPLLVYVAYQSEDTAAWILLGKSYTAILDWQNAENAYGQAINLDSKSIDAFLGRGEMYLSAGDGQRAGSDFTQVLALDPRSFDGNLGLARAYMLQGLYTNAASRLGQAKLFINGDAQQAAYDFWLATDQEALNQPTAAARNYVSLLSLPTNAVPTDWAATAQQFLTGTPVPGVTVEVTPTK